MARGLMRQPHGGQESQKSASPPRWTSLHGCQKPDSESGTLSCWAQKAGVSWAAVDMGLPRSIPQASTNQHSNSELQTPSGEVGVVGSAVQRQPAWLACRGEMPEGRSCFSGAIFKQVWLRCECLCGCDPQPRVLEQHWTVYLTHHLYLGLCVYMWETAFRTTSGSW